MDLFLSEIRIDSHEKLLIYKHHLIFIQKVQCNDKGPLEISSCKVIVQNYIRFSLYLFMYYNLQIFSLIKYSLNSFHPCILEFFCFAFLSNIVRYFDAQEVCDLDPMLHYLSQKWIASIFFHSFRMILLRDYVDC